MPHKHDKEALEYHKRASSKFGGVCSMIVYYVDGTFLQKSNAICYAWIGRYDAPKKIERAYASLWSRGISTDIAKRYWDWICDPEKSPWRSALKEVEILKDGDEYIAVGFNPQDVLSKPLVNFLIATRAPYEFANRIKLWHDAIENGFSEGEAFVICSIANWDQATDSLFSAPVMGHWPFSSNHFNTKKFIDGTMKETTTVFGDGHSYYPSDEIWWCAYDQRNPFNDILDGNQKYTGIFRKKFVFLYGRSHFRDGDYGTRKKAYEIPKQRYKEWIK
jgi:hypothetical protein